MSRECVVLEPVVQEGGLDVDAAAGLLKQIVPLPEAIELQSCPIGTLRSMARSFRLRTKACSSSGAKPNHVRVWSRRPRKAVSSRRLPTSGSEPYHNLLPVEEDNSLDASDPRTDFLDLLNQSDAQSKFAMATAESIVCAHRNM